MRIIPRSPLIVIEGMDGSGKKTQTQRLVSYLHSNGLSAQSTDFPQYEQNFFGRMTRKYLDGAYGDPLAIHPELASLLYAGDRYESSHRIKQWLNEGHIVVIDRYYTSNLIHQGAKMEEDQLEDFIQKIEYLELELYKIPKPDLVIFLHVEPAISLQLIESRGNPIDGHENLAHLKIAEQRCQYLAKKLDWQTIECMQEGRMRTVEAIGEDVVNLLSSRMSIPSLPMATC